MIAPGAAVEVNPNDAREVLSAECPLLRAAGRHDDGQWLGHTDGVRELRQRTLAEATLHMQGTAGGAGRVREPLSTSGCGPRGLPLPW